MSGSNGDKQTGRPAAGCQNCGSSSWILELDAYPPNHTKIIRLVCAGYDAEQDQRMLCGAYMDVDIVLADIRTLEDREEIVDETQ
jgi:hypothetical protein